MKNEKISMYDVSKKQRGSWGEMSPVTRIVKDKNKDPKRQRKNKKKLIEKEIRGEF